MDLEAVRQIGRNNKLRQRIGRGRASKGKTCGKGHKGRKARTGISINPVFEGGQMPLFRKIRKRGFTNGPFKTVYVAVNLCMLESCFDNGDVVTLETLKEKRIVRSVKDGVKILGRGELSKKLSVKVHAYSATAKEAIEKAGGTAEVETIPADRRKKREEKKSYVSKDE